MPGFRSYNAFLRSAKSQNGLTHLQAQSLYRKMAVRLGSTPNRLDLRRHPRITKQEVQNTLRPPKALKRGALRERVTKSPIPPVTTGPKKRLRSLRDYLRVLEEELEADIQVIGAGVDTGRKKK